jgi:hypothetical protein
MAPFDKLAVAELPVVTAAGQAMNVKLPKRRRRRRNGEHNHHKADK